MKIDRYENLIRRYLLGELAEADQTALEQGLLADRNKFDRVWDVENKLIDGYVRGEMSRADRQRFEDHYLTSPLHRKRIAIAELFLKDIDQTVGEPDQVVPWWRGVLNFLRRSQPLAGGAFALFLLIALGGGWGLIERTRLTRQLAKIQNDAETEHASLKQREQELASRNQELEREIVDERQRREGLNARLEQLRRQQRSTPLAVPSFLLTPAITRKDTALPPPTIPRSAGKVRLLIELDDNDYANYQLRLRTAEGREVLRRHTGKARLGKDRAFVTLALQAGKLIQGDYVLILSGQTADGKSEEIDRYFFYLL